MVNEDRLKALDAALSQIPLLSNFVNSLTSLASESLANLTGNDIIEE